MLEHLLVAVLFHPPGLARADLIDRLVHLGHDVVAVQDVHCVARPLGDHFQVSLPHVAANVLQRRQYVFAQEIEEPVERLLRPLPAHPQQASHAGVDLVDQR